MTEMIRVEVRFRLRSSELDPVEVTQALGITPSFARARGVEDPRTGRKQPTGVWLLKSGEPEESDGEDGLDCRLRSLLDQLEGKAEAVRQLVQTGYRADFYCSCYMQTESEGAEISAATIGRIAALGASLGLSVWIPADLMA